MIQERKWTSTIPSHIKLPKKMQQSINVFTEMIKTSYPNFLATFSNKIETNKSILKDDKKWTILIDGTAYRG